MRMRIRRCCYESRLGWSALVRQDCVKYVPPESSLRSGMTQRLQNRVKNRTRRLFRKGSANRRRPEAGVPFGKAQGRLSAPQTPLGMTQEKSAKCAFGPFSSFTVLTGVPRRISSLNRREVRNLREVSGEMDPFDA